MRKETWIDIGADLIGLQRMDCQYCFARSASELAHALVYKRNYNRRSSWKKINVRPNAMPCCPGCQKFSETYEGRKHAWNVLCDWYGEEVVQAFLDGLDLKIKDNYG